MTPEDKAKDILDCKHCTLGERVCFTEPKTPCGFYGAIIEMAQWKDEQHEQVKQQLIDVACEAFCKCECCSNCGEHKTNCKILGYFKKTMEDLL